MLVQVSNDYYAFGTAYSHSATCFKAFILTVGNTVFIYVFGYPIFFFMFFLYYQ
ncbi:hypothetical protein PMAG_a0806 [Pseudoalteromonas mariniglutinosa NCIMB 1770]|nr:hypothetical protein [Pseudoalteromonas mariniglutinosa NCIMB 1770]